MGKKPAQLLTLLLELTDLDGFLLFDLWMNLFLLNKDSMTIETDRLLIGFPHIETKRGASAHGAAVQETFPLGPPGHPYQKHEEENRQHVNS